MAVLAFIISLKLTMYDFKKIKVSPVVELFRVSIPYRVVVHVEDMGTGSCDVHMTSYQRRLVYVSVYHQFQPYIGFYVSSDLWLLLGVYS